jgi:hypothetical protein
MKLVRALSAALLLFLVSAAAIRAQSGISNWPAPATWSPLGADGGIHAMTDVTPAIPFVAITPCRIADTRAGQGFSGQAGPPSLNTGTRTFQITGTVAGVPAQCGIPSGADAVSFQFTIITPNSAGNLIAWPAGAAIPSVSVLNWSAGEVALGNGTIVPVSAGGALSVRINAGIGGATGELAIDVNGYFSDTLVTGNFFDLLGDTQNALAGFENTRSGTEVTQAILAQVASTGHGTAAVWGRTLGASGHTFGGKFATASTASDSAGVKGVNGYGDPLLDTEDCFTGCWTAGVRGVGNDAIGVLGISRNSGGFGGGVGVSGVLLDSPTGSGEQALGHLAVSFGEDNGNAPWAVFGAGDIGATGTKHFVEPHPTDPSLVIKYTSLEGPEAGTYFRGKGRFAGGIATIEVPEDFRLVTAEEGLTIQVTPIGQMATVAIQRIDLDRIIVAGSRNVEFFYLVNGVRRTFRDLKPIQHGAEFRPRKAGAKMPAYLSDEQKKNLIRNGTYREDGAVNMETAHRLGWDRIWAEREAPRPVPASE